MRSVWELVGAGGGLFSSRRAAEQAVEKVPGSWGSAVGAARPTVREVELFDSADEWARYTGMDRH